MRRQSSAALLTCAAWSAVADVPADQVASLPDFPSFEFKVYSGYLTVPGPFEQNPYDELRIHYQFHTSQRNPAKDPVVTWHQGGPGGSSLYGAYGEMGYFQLAQANKTAPVRGYANPHAWNRIANMLYIEGPAGSSDPIGFSTCVKGGEPQAKCSWNDTSQAEAYTHTLVEFFRAFPEFKDNDLYFTGESYAGQYVPNIADHILGLPDKAGLNLKGVALGNAVTGASLSTAVRHGERYLRDEVDLFWRHGMVSQRLYDSIQAECFKGLLPKAACPALLAEMELGIGPYNIYNVYDNCPNGLDVPVLGAEAMVELKQRMRERMYDPSVFSEAAAGGYDWSCGAMDAMKAYFGRADVQAAMHLGKPGVSGFKYSSSGPDSITLYPELARALRVLIYNGDADACVPYIGNERWTSGLAQQGVLKENRAWHPWYAAKGLKQVAAGYATTYTVPGATTDFSFVTIRLAGHMVPNFQPSVAFAMFERFITATPF